MEEDMPFSLSTQEKMRGLTISQYWLDNVGKKDKIFVAKELGVSQQYRKNTAPIFAISTFEKVLTLGYQTAFCWTNIHSKSFTWGIGLGWIPVHFFVKDHLLLMFGNVKYMLELVRNNLAPNKKKSAYRQITANLDKYLCRK